MEIYCINDIHINSYWKTPACIRLSFYKKFIEDHTLPADVLMVAGDIANDVGGAVNFLCAAGEMFDKVVWIPGNGEYRCWKDESNLTTFEKLNRIDKFVKTKTKANRVSRLGGNSLVLKDNFIVAGGIGMADSNWFKATNKSNETIQEAWTKSAFQFWKTGYSSFEEISAREKTDISKCVTADTDYVMTHFAPSNLVDLNVYRNVLEKAETRFLAFDASEMTDFLKDGAIYHFGHMHIKEKKTVKNANGEFLLINNSVGRKRDCVDNPKNLSKQDFLLKV